MAKHRIPPSPKGLFWMFVLLIVLFGVMIAYIFGTNNVLNWFVEWVNDTPAN